MCNQLKRMLKCLSIVFFVRLSLAPWEQERRIIGMVKSPVKGNQLVLIKMESPVIYSDFVRPVCLSRNHDAWISNETSRCLFLGWGRDRQYFFLLCLGDSRYQLTHYHSLGDNLHEVTAKVVKNSRCDNVTTLCADVVSVFDECRVRD